MKKNTLAIVAILYCFTSVLAQNNSVAELLGYEPDTKLLIIHADDLGVAHSENMASISGLEESPVNSGSIMVPCPWFPEIAMYARNNKSADLGLHLTLNSEWKNYKWGPVTSKSLVSSLVNNNGYFYSVVDSLVMYAKPKEIEIELRNQVRKAIQFGVDVTHLDAHMGAAMSTPEFLESYIKIGREFELPVLLDKRMPFLKEDKISALVDERTVIVDFTATANPSDFENGMDHYYTETLENLKPGLNCLLIHLAYDDDEMKAMTVDHPYWGSAWRQADYNFFTSEKCATILKEQNIKLVTWRELRDKIVRKE